MSWSFALGVVVLFLGFLVSVALHEVGHLTPAKLFGVRTVEYMVGFGPRLWSIRRGETTYGIKWIPMGGYVRMIGMLPPGPGGAMRSSSTGLFQGVVESVREVSAEEIGPGDENRVFYRKPWWQKAIIMAGGPVVNMVLAVVFFAIAMVGIGVPTSQPVVSVVSDCVIPVSQNRAVCEPGDQAAPAKGKLRKGDRITAFDGTPVRSWDQVTSLIRDNGARTVRLEIDRSGDTLTVPVTLAKTQRRSLTDPNALVDAGFLGVEPTRALVSAGSGEVGDHLMNVTGHALGTIVNLPARMAGVWDAAFGGGERDRTGPIGVVGVSRLGGEVAELDIPLGERLYVFVSLLGGLNLAMGLFNLIPLLPFDGGHVAGALWEGLKRAFVRVTGGPSPRHVDPAKALPLTYAMALLLAMMSGLLLYADIVNPVTL